jgi:uncharacterized protein Veg
MKPSLAIKRMDFSKFPREVSEKIKSDLEEITDEVLDLQEGKPTYKKWIQRMAEMYPSVFGIIENKKVEEKTIIDSDNKDNKDNKTETSNIEDSIKELETRIKVIKKMIEKQPKKRKELQIRVKVIYKMIDKIKKTNN